MTTSLATLITMQQIPAILNILPRVMGALLLIALAGRPSVHDDPPPIRHGSCVVQHYDGGIAARQRCAWSGATWTCVGKVCDRGEELPAETRMVAR